MKGHGVGVWLRDRPSDKLFNSINIEDNTKIGPGTAYTLGLEQEFGGDIFVELKKNGTPLGWLRKKYIHDREGEYADG